MPFKDNYTFTQRSSESERIRFRYPGRIPIICEKDSRSDIPSIDKQKYLVPDNLTVGQFIYVIRRRINLSPEKAIFVFVNNVLPPTSALISTIYEKHKDADNFLYMNYSGENCFGMVSFKEIVSESILVHEIV